MRTAFVLAGGGSLGAVQVGMLRALQDHRIAPDFVVGSSVGAINAAFYAGDPTDKGIDRLAHVWSRLKRRNIFPLSARRGLLGLAAASDGFVDPAGLRRLVETHIHYRRLEDADVPCVVVATDLMTGKEAGFSTGPLADLLLASAAIPGIFPPVEIDGRLYVDGGVGANTPLAVALQAGAERIVVLPTGFSCSAAVRPSGAMAIAIQSLNHMIGRQLVRDIHNLRAAADLHVIPPLCPLPVSAHDFSRTSELIERAARSTAQWLEEGGLEEPSVPSTLRQDVAG